MTPHCRAHCPRCSEVAYVELDRNGGQVSEWVKDCPCPWTEQEEADALAEAWEYLWTGEADKDVVEAYYERLYDERKGQ